MNPALVAEIVAKNGTDIEAIIATIGVTNLLKLVPHLMAILATVQAAQKS